MRAVQITWGGKIENNGKRHRENRAIERNISEDMIKQVISEPERTERQSSDCLRYFKSVDDRSICIVALNPAENTYEVITCF